MHKSVATINSPEFINLQPVDLNPLMSSCEIKVLYLGENRNGTYIDKESATRMAATLRGAPIVGYYKEDKDDFSDHGERVIIDDEGVKFECMTRPYGFVAPNADVWFQKFSDNDGFGNQIEREYLMTTGYLWTGQFPECASALKGEGKPQSMELDKDSLKGNWAKNSKSGMEFFIINDAIFSKLCILGEDVEPCFEGASVTAPNVSSQFTSIDSDFKNTLYSMMQDLKKLTFALQGGKDMEGTEETIVVNQENPQADPTPASTEFEETPVVSEEETPTEFKKDRDEEDKSDDDNKKDDSEDAPDADDEEEDRKKKYELLEQEHEILKQQYTELQGKYEALQGLQEKYDTLVNQCNELTQFKLEVENQRKDDLIKSFYMLSDEDKADVIAHKTEYSLEDIESKLSVICVRKKVNFTVSNESEEEKPLTTFSLGEEDSSVPAWIKACENTQKNKK